MQLVSPPNGERWSSGFRLARGCKGASCLLADKTSLYRENEKPSTSIALLKYSKIHFQSCSWFPRRTANDGQADSAWRGDARGQAAPCGQNEFVQGKRKTVNVHRPSKKYSNRICKKAATGAMDATQASWGCPPALPAVFRPFNLEKII